MADLMKDVNYLRFYHSTDDQQKDKDFCKNSAFDQYNRKVQLLFAAPLALQAWQISLANVAGRVDMYKRVRWFKTVAAAGAYSLSLWEYSQLRKKMTFYDRFYPEPTELQRRLGEEALLFKEQAYKQESNEERIRKLADPDKILNYAQFYMLGPQTHIIAEEDINAADHQQH